MPPWLSGGKELKNSSFSLSPRVQTETENPPLKKLTSLSYCVASIACCDIIEDLAARRRGQRQTHEPLLPPGPRQLLPPPAATMGRCRCSFGSRRMCHLRRCAQLAWPCVSVCVCQRGLCHCCRPPLTLCRYFTVTDCFSFLLRQPAVPLTPRAW